MVILCSHTKEACLIPEGMVFEGNVSGKINLHGNIFSCFTDPVNVKATFQTKA